jgi:branched-chain amino acid transport system permease protein
LIIYAIIALSLNLVVGYCGLLNMAQAAYFAVGAYSYALASISIGCGPSSALLLAVVVSAALSLALSLPTWRVRDELFVLTTLAVQVLTSSVLNNWRTVGAQLGTWGNLTNGPFGIGNIPKPAIIGIRFDTIGRMAVLAAALGLIAGSMLWILSNSPWRRALEATRDDELAARSLGKNVRLLRIQAFAFSCGLTGLAGAIYSMYVGSIDPSLASLDGSILMLAMLIVGGSGNFRGPIVGAALLLVFPELMRFAQLPERISSELRLMAYGMLLLIVVHLRPLGVAGDYRIE